MLGGPAGRTAPSTTGDAHPGTLLSALLAWLDARSSGRRFVLRWDDADPERCQERYLNALRQALVWLGLHWDTEQSQREQRAVHEQALDCLASQGLLYACQCSRAQIQKAQRQGPDGHPRYPGTCRDRVVTAQTWRQHEGALRLRLPDSPLQVAAEEAIDLGVKSLETLGDPVLRRRDAAIAYQLSVVCDDAQAGVDRVVRGRDLQVHTPLQAYLHDVLGYARPAWRHHLLLLQPQGEKLAKFHGAVGCATLSRTYQAPELCGILAQAAGLQNEARPCTPQALLPSFSWQCVRVPDRILSWNGAQLELGA